MSDRNISCLYCSLFLSGNQHIFTSMHWVGMPSEAVFAKKWSIVTQGAKWGSNSRNSGQGLAQVCFPLVVAILVNITNRDHDMVHRPLFIERSWKLRIIQRTLRTKEKASISNWQEVDKLCWYLIGRVARAPLLLELGHSLDNFLKPWLGDGIEAEQQSPFPERPLCHWKVPVIGVTQVRGSFPEPGGPLGSIHCNSHLDEQGSSSELFLQICENLFTC